MGIKDLFKSFFAEDVLTRFEIIQKAISGTMSKFYKVRERKTDKIFGLKVLDKRQTTLLEQRLAPLKKPSEGDIASMFDHPRIVKTLEHGLTREGEQYLVMEYLDGPGLNSLVIAKEPNLEGNRLSLMLQAAEALAEVHKQGYIHRDVCPRNFVVSSDLATLKLIDFGLTVPNTPEFTRPGNRTGTPAYMAPEVVRRKVTSPKLDIFSFGVTAYEICSFRHPWEAGADGQAALAHDTEEATPLKNYCPDLNPLFLRLIMQCISANADRRPASFNEVIRQLKAIPSEQAT